MKNKGLKWLIGMASATAFTVIIGTFQNGSKPIQDFNQVNLFNWEEKDFDDPQNLPWSEPVAFQDEAVEFRDEFVVLEKEETYSTAALEQRGGIHVESSRKTRTRAS